MPAMPSSRMPFAIVCLALVVATAAPAARLQDNVFGVTSLDAERAWVVGNFGAVIPVYGPDYQTYFTTKWRKEFRAR